VNNATHEVKFSTTTRLAWLVPVAALVLAVVFGPSLESAGWPDTRVAALELLIGIGAGYLWQRLNRRDFVSRFFPWSLLVVVGVALAALWPGNVQDFADQGWTTGGLLVGVVLAEGWLRRHPRPSLP
jgi:hypothetical protein